MINRDIEVERIIEIIYNGLYAGENSIPTKLRVYRELDREQLKDIIEALDYAINYYKSKEFIPKKLAISMVDILTLFSFREGFFNKDFSEELESIGIELVEKAYELFS